MKATTEEKSPSDEYPYPAGLARSAIQTVPVGFSWSDSDGWDSWESNRCEICSTVTTENACPTCERNGTESELFESEGPLMDYYYPLPGFTMPIEEACTKIMDLPLCLVHIEPDMYGLALTGGGMDLSWEIDEAYMRLGYLPPFHFADLPDMAGRGRSERDRWVIAGCISTVLYMDMRIADIRAHLAQVGEP